jgi:hypothetical protein
VEAWSYNASGRHPATPQEPYTYQEYPKVLYAWADNPTGWISCVVSSEEEEMSLSSEWLDHPGKCVPPRVEDAPSAPAKAKK